MARTMDVPTEYYLQAALNFHRQSTYGGFPEPMPPGLHRDAEACSEAGQAQALASSESGDAEHLDRILRVRRSRRVRSARLSHDVLTGALRSAMAPCADTGLRPYPSAGGCYAVSAYCHAGDVHGVDPGAYRFVPGTGALVPLDTANEPAVLDASQLLRTTVLRAESAQAILFLVADLRRVGDRYGERGYRYALLEAGHLSQNLGLAFETRGVSQCPLGGFSDDAVRRGFALRDQLQLPLYAMALP